MLEDAKPGDTCRVEFLEIGVLAASQSFLEFAGLLLGTNLESLHESTDRS